MAHVEVSSPEHARYIKVHFMYLAARDAAAAISLEVARMVEAEVLKEVGDHSCDDCNQDCPWISKLRDFFPRETGSFEISPKSTQQQCDPSKWGESPLEVLKAVIRVQGRRARAGIQFAAKGSDIETVAHVRVASYYIQGQRYHWWIRSEAERLSKEIVKNRNIKSHQNEEPWTDANLKKTYEDLVEFLNQAAGLFKIGNEDFVLSVKKVKDCYLAPINTHWSQFDVSSAHVRLCPEVWEDYRPLKTFTEDTDAWLRDLKGSHVLLWKGAHGSGKTEAVKHWLSSLSATWAVHFCSRQDGQCDPLLDIVAQLSVKVPAVRDVVVSIRQPRSLTLEELWKNAILKPLTGVSDRVLVVLDGLDECLCSLFPFVLSVWPRCLRLVLTSSRSLTRDEKQKLPSVSERSFQASNVDTAKVIRFMLNELSDGDAIPRLSGIASVILSKCIDDFERLRCAKLMVQDVARRLASQERSIILRSPRDTLSDLTPTNICQRWLQRASRRKVVGVEWPSPLRDFLRLLMTGGGRMETRSLELASMTTSRRQFVCNELEGLCNEERTVSMTEMVLSPYLVTFLKSTECRTAGLLFLGDNLVEEGCRLLRSALSVEGVNWSSAALLYEDLVRVNADQVNAARSSLLAWLKEQLLKPRAYLGHEVLSHLLYVGAVQPNDIPEMCTAVYFREAPQIEIFSTLRFLMKKTSWQASLERFRARGSRVLRETLDGLCGRFIKEEGREYRLLRIFLKWMKAWYDQWELVWWCHDQYDKFDVWNTDPKLVLDLVIAYTILLREVAKKRQVAQRSVTPLLSRVAEVISQSQRSCWDDDWTRRGAEKLADILTTVEKKLPTSKTT